MKLNAKFISVFLFGFIIFSCGDDDSAPDPRAGFVGNYEFDVIEYYIITSLGDTTILTNFNTEIFLEIDPEFANDQLRADLEEFLSELVGQFLTVATGQGANFEAEIDFDEEDEFFEVSGPNLEIDNLDFNVVATETNLSPTFTYELVAELEAEGELEEDELFLELKIKLINPSNGSSSLTFFVETTGEKE